jgi:protein-S-isoprenylcysteine O-methyltransferase Ste14
LAKNNFLILEINFDAIQIFNIILKDISLKTISGIGCNMNKHHERKESYSQRDDLTGEHKFGDYGQLILAILFVTIWISDTFILEYTTFLNHIVPNAIRTPLGIVILLVSGYLAVKGMHIVFGEKREEPGVIRKSVFSVVRHPIYLSEILLYLGLLMISLSLAATFILFIAILFMHYISKHEERLLLERFGDDYKQYIREVPMWIPGLWKR